LPFQERNVLMLTFNFMSVAQTTVSEERTTDEVQARDILLELTYQSNILHGHIITLHILSRWLKFIVEYNWIRLDTKESKCGVPGLVTIQKSSYNKSKLLTYSMVQSPS